MRPSIVVLVALLAWSPTSDAMGQTEAPGPATAPSNVEDAHRHFQRGAQLFRDASFDAALAEFKRAYEIIPNYRVLYNMGQVEVELHDYVAALRLFRSYLDQGGSELSPERRSEVETELQQLGLRVGHVSMDCDAADAEILIDEVSVGKTPLPGPFVVNAGVRRVLVRKSGYASVARSVTVVGGETSRMKISLTPEPGQAAALGARAWTVNRTPMWIGVTATAALGTAALTCALLAKRADDDLGSQLATVPADKSRIDSDRSHDKIFSGVADGLAVGTAIALVFTLYEALRTSRSPSDGAPSTAPRADVRIAPTGGLQLTGRF